MIWATRFRRDFGWIDLPMLDDRGEPIHRRGVTDWPGLYFLGLPCPHTPKSSVLCGAEHVASAASATAPGRT